MKRCSICRRRMIPWGWFIGPWALWRSIWRIAGRMDCGGDCLRCVDDAEAGEGKGEEMLDICGCGHRLDLVCTDCGDPMWANLYGYFGCVNWTCQRFGQMVPMPANTRLSEEKVAEETA